MDRLQRGKDERVPQLPARVKRRVNWICTPSLGGQERPGLAEAAGLLGLFMLTRLRGCWREEDRPRAPQTVVGGGCVAWAPPLGGFLLGSGCSLDTEEEGVEKSLALLCINCLRAAD